MRQRLVFGVIAAVLVSACLATVAEAIPLPCGNVSKWCQIFWCC